MKYMYVVLLFASAAVWAVGFVMLAFFDYTPSPLTTGTAFFVAFMACLDRLLDEAEKGMKL